MYRFVFLFLMLSSQISAKTIVFPAPPDVVTCTHGTGQTRNNFFPHMRFSLTPLFVSSNTAFSLLAEVGIRHYRANATLGCIPFDSQRFKLSVEYLVQKTHVNFTSGQISTSLHQIAGGGKYRFCFFDSDWVEGIEVGATYSYAPSHFAKRRVCQDTQQSVNRHIAGSWSSGGSIGAVITPIECGRLTVAANYDFVHFRPRFHLTKPTKKGPKLIRPNKNECGLGASLEWDQRFWCCLDWNFKAQFLRPYTYLETSLKYVSCFDAGNLSCGVFGGYTHGRGKLACSSCVGFSLGYTFGVQDFFIISNGCAPCGCASPSDLEAWVRSPAVYIPEVLAVRDELLVCTKPTSKTIPPQLEQQGFYFFDISPFFAAPQGGGVALHFTATGLPADASLDAKSGFITGNNTLTATQTFTVTVTATDKCGSASQTFKLTYVGGAF